MPQRSDAADLMLRFGRVRLRARVYWPAAPRRPALTVLLAATPQPASADELSRGLCIAAASIVLALPGGHERDHGDQIAALGWASEHGAELGADAGRLLVAGHAGGGAAAAWLAVRAHDHGWPGLVRQVLLYPQFSATHPLPGSVDGLAPATIATAGDAVDDGRRYAARLRSAGVDVDELRILEHSDWGRARLFGDLGRSVERSS